MPFANGDGGPTLELGTWKSAPGEVAAAVTEAQDLKAASIRPDAEDMAKIAGMGQGYRFINGAIRAMEGSSCTLDWLWSE